MNRLESGSHFNQQRNQKLKSTFLQNQRSALSYPSSPSKLSTPGSWLLGVWTFPPNPRYLLNLNIFTFPYFVMLLSTSGSYLLEYASENRSRQPERSSSRRCTSLKTRVRRLQLQPHLYRTSILGFWSWETTLKPALALNPDPEMLAELMIKHWAANITYRTALERLGREPRMENLPPVRAALKELYILIHIEWILFYALLYCVTVKYYE